MYNAVVPAMQAIDPTIKFAALELADFSGQAQALASYVCERRDCARRCDWRRISIRPATRRTRTQRSSSWHDTTDSVSDVQLFYTEMATNPALTTVPVWVTENNVNADYDAGNGMSACNPEQTFVDDLRGSSPFFAAWRPYVFSQLGKAGVQALYHWDFGADPQFGEVDDNTDALQLSYWVDYWLGQDISADLRVRELLQSTSARTMRELETLPVINSDGSVVIMVANHAVNAPDGQQRSGSRRAVCCWMFPPWERSPASVC